MAPRGVSTTTACLCICFLAELVTGLGSTSCPLNSLELVSLVQGHYELRKDATGPLNEVQAEYRKQNRTAAMTSTETDTHLLLRGPVVGADLAGEFAPVIGLKPGPGEQGFAFELRIPKLKCYARSLQKWNGEVEPIPFTMEWFKDQKGCFNLAGAQLKIGWQFYNGEWIYLPIDSYRNHIEAGLGAYFPLKDYQPGVGIGSYQEGYFSPLYRFYVGLFHQWTLEILGNTCKDHPGGTAPHLTFEPSFRHTMTWTPGYPGGPSNGFDGNRLQGFGTLTYDQKGTGPHKTFGEVRWDMDPKDKGRVKGIGGEVRRNAWFGPTIAPCPFIESNRKAGDFDAKVPENRIGPLPQIQAPDIQVKWPKGPKVELPESFKEILRHLPPTGDAPEPTVAKVLDEVEPLGDNLKTGIETGVDKFNKMQKEAVDAFNRGIVHSERATNTINKALHEMTDSDPKKKKSPMKELGHLMGDLAHQAERAAQDDAVPFVKKMGEITGEAPKKPHQEDEAEMEPTRVQDMLPLPDGVKKRLMESPIKQEKGVLSPGEILHDVMNQELPKIPKVQVSPPRILGRKDAAVEMPEQQTFRLGPDGFPYTKKQFFDKYGLNGQAEWDAAGKRSNRLKELVKDYGEELGENKFQKHLEANKESRKARECKKTHPSCKERQNVRRHKCYDLCVCTKIEESVAKAQALAVAYEQLEVLPICEPIDQVTE